MFNKDWKRAKRGGKDVPRPPGTPTPCKTCPKGAPENERHFILSNRNLAAINRYDEQKATGGACLTEGERSDAWLMKLFRIIDRMLADHKQAEDQRFMAEMLAAMAGGK